MSLSFFSYGFKLEKNIVQLTQTESVKAPEPGEEKKVREGPASPTFKMNSFDDFMTSSPINKTPDIEKSKTKHRKSSGRVHKKKAGKVI